MGQVPKAGKAIVGLEARGGLRCRVQPAAVRMRVHHALHSRFRQDCSAITFLEQLQLHNILDYINFFYMPVDKAKRPAAA